MQVASEEALSDALAWALDAAAPPAMVVVFQRSAVDVSVPLAACRSVTESVIAVATPGSDWLSRGLSAGGAAAPPQIELLVGALSSIPGNQRSVFNAARDLILTLKRKIVFVEAEDKSTELHRDFPDVFACVRQEFHLQDFDDDEDYLFDSGGARRLSTLARRLPPIIKRGVTLIEGGRVHFKSPPQIPCPKCGRILERGIATIVFQLAPEATQRQTAPGWVCPCGESYVPGPAARAAHARAFGLPSIDPADEAS